MEALKFAAIGAAIGIANVIPGVSGGTIAVVFGIYERLIALVTLNIKHIMREWKFWLPLAAGALLGIFLFSKVISFLFARFALQTAWCFMGIVAGSIPALWMCMVSPLGETSGGDGRAKKKLPRASALLAAFIALLLMLAMNFFSRGLDHGTAPASQEAQEFSMRLAAIFFASGALGAIAMIIPGISGSFLLVVIGTYASVIAAVSNLNIPLIIPLGLGVAAGLLCGAALIRVLLKKAPFATYGAIFGLVAGSLAAIFPGTAFDSALALLGAALCFASGASLSFFTSR
jgi:putative membrane protein